MHIIFSLKEGWHDNYPSDGDPEGGSIEEQGRVSGIVEEQLDRSAVLPSVDGTAGEHALLLNVEDGDGAVPGRRGQGQLMLAGWHAVQRCVTVIHLPRLYKKSYNVCHLNQSCGSGRIHIYFCRPTKVKKIQDLKS